MKTSFQAPSTDPSPLYGRIFERELRDKIFAKACEVLGLDPEKRDDYVGTEYYTMRCIEDVGKALLTKAIDNIEHGMGQNSALAPLLDFKDMVNTMSYFPKSKSEKPAPKLTPKPAASAPAKPALASTPIGEQVGPQVVAELKAAVAVTPAPVSTPAEAPAAVETPIVTVKGKARKVANG
jgi:hypothetical protein